MNFRANYDNNNKHISSNINIGKHIKNGNKLNMMIRSKMVSILLAVVVSFLFGYLCASSSIISMLPSSSSQCLVSYGTYKGPKYSNGQHTLPGSDCLIESPWMAVHRHSVVIDSNTASAPTVINDWLWIDYHDRVNIVVGMQTSSGSPQVIRVLNQTKYAIPERFQSRRINNTTTQYPQNLALVGGIIEPNGETPLEAAKREVLEELHLLCETWIGLGGSSDDDDNGYGNDDGNGGGWKDRSGRDWNQNEDAALLSVKVGGQPFRTDVNRGIGWVYPFLALDCHDVINDNAKDFVPIATQLGGEDLEHQDTVDLSIEDFAISVKDGLFVEVQWSMSASLALLYIQTNY